MRKNLLLVFFILFSKYFLFCDTGSELEFSDFSVKRISDGFTITLADPLDEVCKALGEPIEISEFNNNTLKKYVFPGIIIIFSKASDFEFYVFKIQINSKEFIVLDKISIGCSEIFLNDTLSNIKLYKDGNFISFQKNFSPNYFKEPPSPLIISDLSYSTFILFSIENSKVSAITIGFAID